VLTVESTTSAPLTLTLTGRTALSVREVDGVATGRVRGTVVLPSGTHVVRLISVAVSAPARTLPTTGLAAVVPLAALLVLALLAVRRRRVMAR
jgi:hypothetical protein